MNGFIIRPAGPADLEGFKQLRALAGAGFTSFQRDDSGLRRMLERSAAAFAAAVAPGDEHYLLALEAPGGAVAGAAGVKATIGAKPPFFNFRVLTIAQASAAASRRFDMDVLILVNEFTGCTEVGALFVRPERRTAGIGRALAQARYLLMAAAAHRFQPRVVSELRGVVSAEGRSPFWEHLGRHFFKMGFREADALSAAGDSQFILDLMPKYPIYADLLAEEARAAIGRCHDDGRGARRLLEWEGFSYDHVVDIFDGGPLLSASRDAIRTVREARRVRLHPREDLPEARRALIARSEIGAFRCAPAQAQLDGADAFAPPSALRDIGLADGGEALLWIDHAS